MTRSEILAAFRALPLHRRHEAMRVACSYALEVWERYARDSGPIEYSDSVVGLRHVVDLRLPTRAIELVDRWLAGDAANPAAIWDAYTEPIVAMQDDDLDFPGDIQLAYYAIYNLFGFVFGLTRLYDDGELVVRQADTGEGFLEEWWSRTWDAWASRGDVRYAASELTPAIFDALAGGDIARAVDASTPGTRLRAVLLALAKRHPEAVDEAADVLASAHDAELPLRLGSSDAIAVDGGGRTYAAIHGNRYIVRDVDDHRLRLSGACGFAIRRVAFAGTIVIFAGEVSDEIGPYKTVVVGEELHSRDHGYRAEHLGTRTLHAIGGLVELVADDARGFGVLGKQGHRHLGDGALAGAVFDDDGAVLVTYAGRAFTVWSRGTTPRPLRAMELEHEIRHAVIVGRRLVLALRDAPARVFTLP